MEATTVLEMDIRREGIIPTIQAVQADSGRSVRCHIAGITDIDGRARIYCKKPSGKETYTDATILSSNCITFELTDQMLAETGNTLGQIQVLSANKNITTFKFKIEVSENKIMQSSITSSDDYKSLIEALRKIEKFDPIEITNEEIDALASEVSM